MFRKAGAMLLIILSAAAAARTESCRWPLNEPRRISSSFAEYRDWHYHAGIDLRTFGRIGLPCLAPEVCDVVRLRVSPNGYGKAVYVSLQDGRLAVFAHLNGFSRELDSLAYHRRLERGKNWCDIQLKPGTIRFDAGETIAFTGTSGSRFPHLHFEMRDPAGRPFNPLVSLFKVPDSCVPVISSLEVVPLSWGSVVNGSPLPFTARFRLVREAHYALDDTLLLDGIFGFGVSAYDKQIIGSYRMAPYSVELVIDGRTVYSIKNDKFDYSQSGDIPLEYESRGGMAPGRYLVLFRKPGNSMNGREGSGIVANDAGFAETIILSPGLHEGRIVVRDANGNEAQGLFRFMLDSRPVVEVSRGASGGAARIEIDISDPPDGAGVSAALSASVDGGRTWSPLALERLSPRTLTGKALGAPWALYRCMAKNGNGVRVERYFAFPDLRADADSVFCEIRHELHAEGLYLKIGTDRALASVPSVRGGQSWDSIGVIQTGPRDYVAFVPVKRLVNGVNIFSIRGTDHRGFPLDCVRAFSILTFGMGGPVAFEAPGGVAIRLTAPSVRGTAALVLSDAADSTRHSDELSPLTEPFALDFPLDGYARPLRCDFDSGRAACLFRWEGKSGWRCIGVPAREGSVVEIRGPGTYAVFDDSKAPVIGRLGFSRRGSQSGFFKSKLYYVSIYERGSGIDPEASTAFLNGERIICEYDEYRGRIAIPIPRSHSAGPAKLRVEVFDLAGNTSVGEFNLMIE